MNNMCNYSSLMVGVILAILHAEACASLSMASHMGAVRILRLYESLIMAYVFVKTNIVSSSPL